MRFRHCFALLALTFSGCHESTGGGPSLPEIESASTLTGPTDSSIRMILKGRHLESAVDVVFRSQEDGSEFEVTPTAQSSRELVFDSPRIPCDLEGLFSVFVRFPQSLTTNSIEFNFLAVPSIFSIDPRVALIEGGSTLTLGGECFREGATVSFGGAESPGVERVNERELTVVIPSALEASEVSLIVTNPNGRKSLPSGPFHYTTLPRLESTTPLSNSRGNVPIGVRAFDDESDLVDVLLTLLVNNERVDMTLVEGTELIRERTGKEGVDYQVVWDSVSDLGDGISMNARVELVPIQSGLGLRGTPVLTDVFSIDNRSSITLQSVEGSPGTSVEMAIDFEDIVEESIIGVDVTLSYDSTWLDVLNVTAGEMAVATGKTLRFFESVPGCLRFTVLGESSDPDENEEELSSGSLASVSWGLSSEAEEGEIPVTPIASRGIAMSLNGRSLRARNGIIGVVTGP